MDKFPHSSLKAHNIFPIHGFAVIVKRNFPIRRSWGNLFSLFLLSHSWGKYNVPFVIHGEIFFSSTPGFACRGEKSHPYFSSVWDWHNGKKLIHLYTEHIELSTT